MDHVSNLPMFPESELEGFEPAVFSLFHCERSDFYLGISPVSGSIPRSVLPR